MNLGDDSRAFANRGGDTFGRSGADIADRTTFDIFGALYGVSHPLRRPDRYFATYQRLWQKSAATTPTIAARDA